MLSQRLSIEPVLNLVANKTLLANLSALLANLGFASRAERLARRSDPLVER